MLCMHFLVLPDLCYNVNLLSFLAKANALFFSNSAIELQFTWLVEFRLCPIPRTKGSSGLDERRKFSTAKKLCALIQIAFNSTIPTNPDSDRWSIYWNESGGSAFESTATVRTDNDSLGTQKGVFFAFYTKAGGSFERISSTSSLSTFIYLVSIHRLEEPFDPITLMGFRVMSLKIVVRY